MGIVVKHTGNFSKTRKFLTGLQKLKIQSILDKYGQEGVTALSAATPVDTGLTASSWGYDTRVSGSSFSITWTNSNVVGGTSIAILIQYGHGTGTGGYVQGIDYINPALKPVFDRMLEAVWQEVTSL